MYTINYTTARAQLAETMDRVNEDCIPLLVTRQKGEPVVTDVAGALQRPRRNRLPASLPRQCRTPDQIDWQPAC